MMVLTKADLTIREKNCKQVTIRANAINNNKMVFILLIKIVISYINLTIVEIREPSL